MKCHYVLALLLFAGAIGGTNSQFFDDDDDEEYGSEISMEAESKAVSAAEGSNSELSCSTYFDEVAGCKFYRYGRIM